MKKSIGYIFAVAFICVLICVGNVKAAGVNAKIADFPVSVNYQSYDGEEYSDYPILVYNAITYIPLTFYKANLLGIETELAEKDFFISNALRNTPAPYQNERLHIKNDGYAVKAEIVPFNIKINNEDYTDGKYPFLFYRNIVYLPLTWRLTNDVFGWNFEFDGTQIVMFTNAYYYHDTDGSGLRIDKNGNIAYYMSPTETYYSDGESEIYMFTRSLGRLGPVGSNLTVAKDGGEKKTIDGYSGYYKKRVLCLP